MDLKKRAIHNVEPTRGTEKVARVVCLFKKMSNGKEHLRLQKSQSRHLSVITHVFKVKNDKHYNRPDTKTRFIVEFKGDSSNNMHQGA